MSADNLAGKDLNEFTFHHLAGFVDGEGAFPIQTRRTPWTRFGFTITPEFKISQHKDNGEILELLQQALGCGKISIKSGQPNQLVLVEKSRKRLTERVIPFFMNYPLIVKNNHFRNFLKSLIGSIKMSKIQTRDFDIFLL